MVPGEAGGIAGEFGAAGGIGRNADETAAGPGKIDLPSGLVDDVEIRVEGGLPLEAVGIDLCAEDFRERRVELLRPPVGHGLEVMEIIILLPFGEEFLRNDAGQDGVCGMDEGRLFGRFFPAGERQADRQGKEQVLFHINGCNRMEVSGRPSAARNGNPVRGAHRIPPGRGRAGPAA